MNCSPIRRWLRFSLRGMLLWTTVLALWLGHWLHQVKVQRSAVQTVQRLRGSVRYDFEPDAMQRVQHEMATQRAIAMGLPAPRLAAPKAPGPDWLRRTLGSDMFETLEDVHLGPAWNLKDADLGRIFRVKTIRRVSASFTNVGDESLPHLGSLADLEILHLSGTRVTDDGLRHLTRLKHLRILGLSHCAITDDGIEYLLQMTNLESLEIGQTQMSTTGVARLSQGLPSCRIHSVDQQTHRVQLGELNLDYLDLPPFDALPRQP